MEETQQQQFVTVRELNMAVQFLSEKLDTGFTTMHDKQDKTNGRLLVAEGEIQSLKTAAFAEKEIEKLAEKAAERMHVWKITGFSTLGGSAVSAVLWAFNHFFSK